jgi:excisionase family DNA binding protein
MSGNFSVEPVVTGVEPLEPPGGPLFDRSEAAQYLGVTERWMCRVMSERRLPTVKLGRRIKISKASLDDFISASTRPANGSAVPPGLATSAKAGSKRPQALSDRAKGQSRGPH